MRILALDTSTEALSVALSVDGVCRTRDEAGGARASQRLLPLCAELLQAAGLRFSDLDLIGVGAGPGAFTGLRTAAAVAQGLAYALDLPVARIDTLMAQAETAFPVLHANGTVQSKPPQAQPGSVVLAANDARMGEMYWEVFRADSTGWQRLHPPAVHSPEHALLAWAEVLAHLPGPGSADMPPLLACGNAWSVHAQGLSTACARLMRKRRAAPSFLIPLGGPDANAAGLGALSADSPLLHALHRAVLHAIACTPSAAAVVRLAQQQYAAGLTVSAALAQPIYVRDKVALTTAERELARASA